MNAKEILLERQQSDQPTHSLAVILDPSGAERFRWEGKANQARASGLPESVAIGPVFVDPDPALIRSGYVAEVFAKYQLHLVHPRVAFGHGQDPGPDFPGHRYQIIAQGPWDVKTIKAICKQESLKKIRVSRRHFPYEPADILKQLKLKEGGNVHLCCFRNVDDKLFWILGRNCIVKIRYSVELWQAWLRQLPTQKGHN